MNSLPLIITLRFPVASDGTSNTIISFSPTAMFIAFGILLAIFGINNNKSVYMFVCLVGLLIYSIYLVYDTQLTMGKGAYKYEIDEYVWAAVNLYIDIIEIFIYILRILGKLNNN